MNPNEIALFNAIRSTLSPQFQDRVDPMSETNFRAIGTALTSAEFQVEANEWLGALYNKVAFSRIMSKLLRNKLSPYKKGSFEYGQFFEEIWVDAARAEIYKGPELYGPGELCEEDPNCKVKPGVTSMYHKRNREERYQTTVFRQTLKKAFHNGGGLTTLVDYIIQSTYSGANRDEYLWMKECFSEYINNPKVALAADQVQTIPNIIDEASGKEFIVTVQSALELLQFNSTNFSPMRREQFSDAGDMTLFIKAGVQPVLNVETLAGAFNQGRLSLDVKVDVVDNFGTNTWDEATQTGVLAMLVDNDWWMVYDNLREFTSWWNPKDLYWNYWLHVWQTYAVSYYKNAIIFKTA